jgi:hypothetical protein
MKHIIPILVFILVVGGVAWFVTKDKKPAQEASKQFRVNETAVNLEKEDLEIDHDEELIKPATQLYQTADSALEAVKKGATNYDDVVLEEFTLPGEDCLWCEEFYSKIRSMMASPDITEDERSYYAELLAISGRPENLGALLNAARSAGNPDEANAYLEAIELTVGNDQVISFLGKELESADETLKESIIAAITNQGSRAAAEILIRESEKVANPDDYYNKGIGLGEFIPDKEAIPPLQELLRKRDPKLSGLAAKALANAGLDGLRIVFDELAVGKDEAADREMIKGLIDHINYDEETEAYLKQIVNKGTPIQKELAQSALNDFKLMEEELDEEKE